MRYQQKSLLTTAVLFIGAVAACAVLESDAPEPVAGLPAAARPAIATIPAHAADTAGESATRGPAPIDFASQIQPLFEGCHPCHFEGGKMYARMPFDDPETIRHTGEALFTRIKDEEARALIRAFIAEGAK